MSLLAVDMVAMALMAALWLAAPTTNGLRAKVWGLLRNAVLFLNGAVCALCAGSFVQIGGIGWAHWLTALIALWPVIAVEIRASERVMVDLVVTGRPEEARDMQNAGCLSGLVVIVGYIAGSLWPSVVANLLPRAAVQWLLPA